MKIETKYEIGAHVWYVFANNTHDEIEVFDSYIIRIDVNKEQKLEYIVDEYNFFNIEEKDIILYEDKDKLYDVIKTKMEEINKENK